MAIDTSAPRSRRALLLGIGGALAALGARVFEPRAVLAEGESIRVGDTIDTARTVTWLTNRQNDNDVIKAESKGRGRGVYGVSAAGPGVDGRSYSHYGVRGQSTRYVGVEGRSDRSVGVFAFSRTDLGVHGVSSQDVGVKGTSFGSHGVQGVSEGSGSSVYALKRASRYGPDGNAMLGEIRINDSPRTAIVGTTTGTGAGVRGSSEQGRGGLFSGPIAQLRLMPSVATHPANGAMGDVVADTNGRLWFCKGGANWAQLA
jgi:hypothetical protein